MKRLARIGGSMEIHLMDVQLDPQILPDAALVQATPIPLGSSTLRSGVA